MSMSKFPFTGFRNLLHVFPICKIKQMQTMHFDGVITALSDYIKITNS